MTHPDYIREKAIEFRIERQMSIDEIADRLALSKTTVYYWVRDIPLQREVNRGPAQVAAAAAKEAKWDRMRDEAYAEGWEEYDQLLQRATFQQFVVLYIAEGSKRDRNRVAVANSDVHVMKLATSWIRYLTMHKLGSRSNITLTRISMSCVSSGAPNLALTARSSRCNGSRTAASWAAGAGARSTAR